MHRKCWLKEIRAGHADAAYIFMGNEANDFKRGATLFRNNLSFATSKAFEHWAVSSNVNGVPMDCRDSTFIGGNIVALYSNGLHFENVNLIQTTAKPAGTAFVRNTALGYAVFENMRVEGWKLGIDMPSHGANQVIGSYYNNTRNFRIAYYPEGVLVSHRPAAHLIVDATVGLLTKVNYSVYTRKGGSIAVSEIPEAVLSTTRMRRGSQLTTANLM